MLSVQVWDEISPLNGIPAEEIFANRDDLDRARGDIFLVFNNGVLSQIEIGTIIRGNYGFAEDLSIEEIANQYLEMREMEAARARERQLTVEELQEQVAMLSYQVMMMEADVVVEEEVVEEQQEEVIEEEKVEEENNGEE